MPRSHIKLLLSVIFTLSLLWLSNTPALVQGAASNDTLTIINFANGETIRYDLPLLKGTAPDSDTILIESAGTSTRWPVHAGNWRAFVPLVEGDNTIIITTSQGHLNRFTLVYQAQTNGNAVRLVYPMGSDSPGTFDAPTGAPNDRESAVRRLRLTGRILQSLTAEFLYERDASRRTFRLLADENGFPLVATPRSPLTVSQLHSMDGQQLWSHYVDLFDELPERSDIIDIAVMADTHYNAATDTLLAHTALGGYPLALFGGSTLYSYPETLQELIVRLQDVTPIEPELFPEYGRRREYWATYTTSIGAILHEVGHSFGLQHPDPYTDGDIMWRGFDYLNRAMVTHEPSYGVVEPSTAVMPQWTDEDVQILLENPWMDSGNTGGGEGGPILLEAISLPRELALLVPIGASANSYILPVTLTWEDVEWNATLEQGSLPSASLAVASGKSGDNLVLSVNPADSAAGNYEGTITIATSEGRHIGAVLVQLFVSEDIQYRYFPTISGR